MVPRRTRCSGRLFHAIQAGRPAGRAHERATLILAERLEKLGRSPGSAAEGEYIEALTQAATELDPDTNTVDRDRLVASAGARAAIDARAQAVLAARRTAVTAETYLAACVEAENVLYPKWAFDAS